MISTGAALLASGALASAGSIYNNYQNLKYQQGVNDTQIRLADTAHQREVRDLYAAGLNPILSAQGSGASVPQLGTPSLDNPTRGLADSISSAAKVNALDLPLKESQVAVNSAQAENLHNQGVLYKAQADVINRGISSAVDFKDFIDDKAEDFGSWIGKKLVDEYKPLPVNRERETEKRPPSAYNRGFPSDKKNQTINTPKRRHN